MRWKLPWCYVSYSIHFLRFADLGVQIAGNFAPVEEQPVMPVECISFMLQVVGVFSHMDSSTDHRQWTYRLMLGRRMPRRMT
ncbi:Hypothetical predicted protein [Olea europaea subsp. europaea]|uniref:Uncharacterized protein n=1 Tax=Olea europaea subsp. europaea TaxID=158383 RepID=A0A8S0Q1F6_OLEEU|nr:Hypothetical predicted protein [Olea europaea subsp. europaea]